MCVVALRFRAIRAHMCKSPTKEPAMPTRSTHAAALTLTIGRRSFPVANLADASARYQRFRGSKLSSRVPDGFVTDASGTRVARVSYNGRVWAPDPWQPGAEPILE